MHKFLKFNLSPSIISFPFVTGTLVIGQNRTWMVTETERAVPWRKV